MMTMILLLSIIFFNDMLNEYMQIHNYKWADRKDCGQFALTTSSNAYNGKYLVQIAKCWYSFVYSFSPSWNHL